MTNEQGKVKARAAYNAAADFYDHPALSFWERYGRRTVERLGLRGGERVLDVGCGSGASAVPAAQAVGPNGRVLGVDLSTNLLALGRQKAAQAGLRNVEFIEGDMMEVDAPDASFDAVISVFSIFFVSDMEELARRLWRKVRPGGKLAVTTWGPRFIEPGYSVWLEAVRAERPDLYSAFQPWDRVTEPELLRQMLAGAGIVECSAVAESGQQELASPEDWWAIAKGNGMRWTIEQMGPEAAARVRERVAGHLRKASVGAVETNVVYGVATKPSG